MDKDFLGKLLKKTNNRMLYVILIIGIVLMLFSQNRPAEVTTAERISEQEQLSDIISGIAGAGRVKVMVTYYGTGMSSIVYDTRTRGDEIDKTAVVSGGEAVVAGESYPRVKGVVVIAQGADSETVRDAIREAVMVALNVPEYKVSVLRGG